MSHSRPNVPLIWSDDGEHRRKIAAAVNLINQNIYTDTFTPELWDDTLATDPTPPTYSNQIGRFIRVDSLVIAHIRLTVTNLGGLTAGQQARIGGLPFRGLDIANYKGICNIGWLVNVTYGTDIPAGTIERASKYIALHRLVNGGAIANLTIGNFTAAGDIAISCIYETDE